MKRLAAAAFFAALGNPNLVWAEQIVVTSGEHDSFTRIVLPLPEGATWRLENTPGSSQIIFENHDAGFDLSSAFEIIPRTRLTALLARDSNLEMQLGCDCPVTAFVEQNRFLVVDISDGPDLVQDVTEIISPSEIPVSDFSYGELLWRSSELEAGVPYSVGINTIDASEIVEQEANSPVAEPDLVLETQTRLLEAFSDAASRGLLDPVQPIQNADVVNGAEESVPEIFDSSEIVIDETLMLAGNIRVTDSKDVPRNERINDIALSGAVCIDSGLVDVAGWGGEEPFSMRLGMLNRELVDDIGRIKPPIVVELAKFYLHFGFGAEARRTLSLEPGLMNKYPELLDLASIFELGFAQNPRSLHRFSDCNSDLALWGILAAQDFPDDRAVDSKAALRGLQNLPSHLRYVLGPELSEKFLKRGEIENANLALRSFDSLLENEGNPPKMAEAQALLMVGAESDAKAALNEIIEEDTPDAPAALIALIQKLVDDDQPIPADIALLAESYTFELQDTAGGYEMLRAFILASTKSAQYDKTFASLQKQENRFTEDDRTELTSHLFSEIADRTSDAAFVDLFFTRYPMMRTSVTAETQLALAKRLLSIGFVEQASELSASLPEAYTSNQVRLLRANILLQTEQYANSLLQLDGLEGAEAAKLKGQVLEQLGENKDAAVSFDAADMPERAASTLWLASDWPNLVEETTPVFGAMAQLKNENPAIIPEDDQMLARSEAAISASAAARRTLEQTLQTLELMED